MLSSIMEMFIWISDKTQENPSFFFLLKFCSVLSVSHRIFLQIGKIILFVRTNKIFSKIDTVYITYDSWKGLFKNYLILHFKILSFSSLVIWFFDNPFRLAHLILLFSLMVSSFLLLLFFITSRKKLNFFESLKLFFFFFIFLTFLFISFCYNLNLFLFIKYSVWLDMIISWEYYLNHMDNISFINKIRLIYKVFFMSVEMVEKDPDIFKSLRTFNNHKKK